MTVLDPNILNPYMLLDPSIANVISIIITAISAIFSFIISWYFFRSYRFLGLGYLLGLPTGFTFLGLSFVFEYFSLIYRINDLLYPELFWIQLTLQSEALALIAVSYRFKDHTDRYSIEGIEEKQIPIHPLNRHYYFSTSIKRLGSMSFVTFLFMLFIFIPFVIPISDLILKPYFDYPGLADLRFFMSIFNMIALAYIVKRAIVPLAKTANVKLLLIPAAFALLWLEQYSLLMTYFDNSSVAFIASTIARLAGLVLFVYVMYYATNTALRRRPMEIETRKET